MKIWKIYILVKFTKNFDFVKKFSKISKNFDFGKIFEKFRVLIFSKNPDFSQIFEKISSFVKFLRVISIAVKI